MMVRRILAILLAMWMALACPAVAESGGTNGIAFSDPVLEAKVREAMGVPDGPITQAMADSVTELNLSQPEANVPEEQMIRDLNSLASFPNLESLDLSGNACHDISPLTKLTKLTKLIMYNVPPWDVTPLAEMTQLREFRTSNGLLDAWFIKNLVNLETLEVGLRDEVFPEVALPKLKTLLLGGGSLRDISGIAGCPALEVLNISWNLVEDISPLQGLHLKELYLDGDLITDFSPIQAVYLSLQKKDFEAIFPEDLWGERPKDALVFNDRALEKKVRAAMGIQEGYILRSQAEAVTKLDLSNPRDGEVPEEDKIADITALKYFPNLTELNLAQNNFHRILVLSLLTKLTTLNLTGNDIWDFNGLPGLTTLSSLSLSGNGHDLSFLGSMAGLSTLSIGGGNKIIPPEVAGLKNLTAFFAPGGEIKDISVLRELPNLTQVDLSWNTVEDITPLNGLPLTKLYLNGNPIADYRPIEAVYDQLTDKDFEVLSFDPIPDEPLVFSDAGLEAALRAAMNINDRPITQKDAFSVKELRLHSGENGSAPFSDIAPLAYFASLERLELHGSNVADLSPLSKLTRLGCLCVFGGQVSDLTPLAGMQQLMQLDLPNNRITDLTPLSGLVDLKWLDASNNQIADVAPLATLTKLGILKLSGNPILDYSPLKDIAPGLKEKDFEVLTAEGVSDEPLEIADANLKAKLAEALGISNRPITRKDAYFVKDLVIRESNIQNIEPLRYFVNLSSLDASWNQIEDLTPLSGLTKLQGLNLRGNKITDLTPIAGLGKLDYLDVADNQVGDVTPLAQLSNLRQLFLENNPTQDMTPLTAIEQNLEAKDFIAGVPDTIPDEPIAFADAKFEKAVRKLIGKSEGPITQRDAYKVTKLDFSGAKIKSSFKDISPLSYFVNLNYLSMSGNGISDLSPLSNLSDLSTLILDNQKIEDLAPLANLKGLGRLILNSNRIADLKPLQEMTNLYTLELNKNKIKDVSPLASLEGLQELVVQGNQLTDIAPLARLKKLQKLDLRKNKLTDVNALSGLSNLKELYLGGNKIKDFGPVKEIYGQLEQKDFKVR